MAVSDLKLIKRFAEFQPRETFVQKLPSYLEI